MSWHDDDETVDLTVRLVKVSRSAALLDCDGEEEWVPHSLIRGGDLDCEDSDCEGNTGTVEIPQWKAEELGWA